MEAETASVEKNVDIKLKIPVKTFLVKKRINTELIIDWEKGALYTKEKEGSDQEIVDLLEEGLIK